MGYIKTIDKDDNGDLFTARTFLDKLRLSNECWWEDGEKESHFVFRGQWDANWQLLPTAWRTNNKQFNILKEKISELSCGTNHGTGQPTISSDELNYYICLNAEHQAHYDFCKLADELGFTVKLYNPGPIQSKHISKYTHDSISSLKNLSVAQHHGIPTRLIDWTYNPMTACYFSIGREFRPSTEPENISVWALNTKLLRQNSSIILEEGNHGQQSNISLGINFIKPPFSESKYINSQKGLFTMLRGNGLQYFHKNNNRFPSLQEFFSYYDNPRIDEPILYQINLSSKYADDLLLLLDREGISQAHLMPSLDKVSETVRSRWSY